MIRSMHGDGVMFEGPGAGVEQMRRDGELLRSCAAGATARAIRLYWFAPACLSLGRLQPMSDIDLAACARDGIDVIRRPSGGRAVLHHDEVTYALVCRADDATFGGDVMTSCCRIHDAVAAGLRRLGVNATPHAAAAMERRVARTALSRPDCFAGPAAAELVDEHGGKLVGSAQARRGGALLQHGSVLLSPSRAEHYLRVEGGDANGRRNRDERPASPGVRALAGRDLTREEVATALAAGFRQTMWAEPR